jgi:hypothetical protein
VKILLDDPDQSTFPIGAQGSAAVYTSGEHGLGRTTQNRDPRAFLVQLALPDKFLTSFGTASRTPQ